MSRPGFSLIELTVVVLLLAILAMMLNPALARVRESRCFPPSCARNFRQLSMSLHMYSNESRGGRFPTTGYYRQPTVDCDDSELPLFGEVSDVYTGTPNLQTMIPEFLPDAYTLLCPDRHEDEIWTFPATAELTSVCYQPDRGVEFVPRYHAYTGYVLPSQPSAAYGLDVPVEPHEFGELGNMIRTSNANELIPVSSALHYDLLYRLKRDDPDTLLETLQGDIDLEGHYSSEFLAEQIDGGLEPDIMGIRTLFRLREGVERFFITDINNPGASDAAQKSIPLTFDRISGDPQSFTHDGRAGSYVLYLDGHVEFVEYAPENFPVTPGMALINESIDASPVFQKRV